MSTEPTPQPEWAAEMRSALGYEPDFGASEPRGSDPQRWGKGAENPWLAELPVGWVAPYPPGYVEAEMDLSALEDEARAIAGKLADAKAAGDGVRLLELRAREASLPTLLAAAEIAFSTRLIEHQQACWELQHQHQLHLRNVQQCVNDEVRLAWKRKRLVDAAAMNVAIAGGEIEKRIAGAKRRILELTYPEAFDRSWEDKMLLDVHLEAVAREKVKEVKETRKYATAKRHGLEGSVRRPPSMYTAPAEIPKYTGPDRASGLPPWSR